MAEVCICMNMCNTHSQYTHVDRYTDACTHTHIHTTNRPHTSTQHIQTHLHTHSSAITPYTQEDDDETQQLLEKPREYQVKFSFPDPPSLNPPILGAYGEQFSRCIVYRFTVSVDVDFGYPGLPLLFKNLNFGVDMDSRGRY